jgi:hypothetical protein
MPESEGPGPMAQRVRSDPTGIIWLWGALGATSAVGASLALRVGRGPLIRGPGNEVMRAGRWARRVRDV